jgi:hypothetical protein
VLPQPQPQLSCSPTSKSKRHCPDDEDDDAAAAEKSPAGVLDPAVPEQENARKRKKPNKVYSNREFADILIKMAKKGIERMEKMMKKPFNPLAIHGIVLRCQQLAYGDKQLNTLLKKLDTQFVKHGKMVRDDIKPKVWLNWYYSACLRLILYSRGQGEKDRRARGVSLLHRIVNNLLFTEGTKAFAVIAAYAGKSAKSLYLQGKLTSTEQGYYLSTAARSSEVDQKEISDMVAKGLSEQLSLLGESYTVPAPAVWVSVVVKITYAFSSGVKSSC